MGFFSLTFMNHDMVQGGSGGGAAECFLYWGSMVCVCLDNTDNNLQVCLSTLKNLSESNGFNGSSMFEFHDKDLNHVVGNEIS